MIITKVNTDVNIVCKNNPNQSTCAAWLKKIIVLCKKMIGQGNSQ